MAIMICLAGLVGARMAAPTAIGWGDLIPHDEAMQSGDWWVENQRAAPTRTDLDGVEIEIRGYMVPVGYKPGTDGQVIAGFLLAPFVGACIHVPPPPANQLILINYQAGFEMASRLWFDPVTVAGIIRVETLDAGLARVGYVMEANDVHF